MPQTKKRAGLENAWHRMWTGAAAPLTSEQAERIARSREKVKRRQEVTKEAKEARPAQGTSPIDVGGRARRRCRASDLQRAAWGWIRATS